MDDMDNNEQNRRGGGVGGGEMSPLHTYTKPDNRVFCILCLDHQWLFRAKHDLHVCAFCQMRCFCPKLVMPSGVKPAGREVVFSLEIFHRGCYFFDSKTQGYAGFSG